MNGSGAPEASPRVVPDAFRIWLSVLRFELGPSFKGPLPWAALGGLLPLLVLVRYFSAGEMSINGRLIGQETRLVPLLAMGHTLVVALSTLLTLCLCLDRTGAHYLRNNDLLMLSRSLGRPSFYLAKMASVLIPAILYSALALFIFWEELFRHAGVNLWRIGALLPPLVLVLCCLIAVYYLMRNAFSNFLIFFLLLFLLPVIYLGNLWNYYSGLLGEGLPRIDGLGFLPQLGVVLLNSLGLVHERFRCDDAWMSLLNVGAWTFVAAGLGLWIFGRKRL